MTARRAPIFVVAVGLLGSQAGHLLAYLARFGALAPQVQSSGPHAYFPVVAKTGLGVAAVAMLGVLLVIAVARMVSQRRFPAEPQSHSYLSLLAILYTVQLACFSAQETLEAAIAGVPTTSAAVLLLWGTLGQLPIAVVSALALRWLLTEFRSAVQEIRAALDLVALDPELVPAVVAIPAPQGEPRLVSETARYGQRKRGPPSFCVSAS